MSDTIYRFDLRKVEIKTRQIRNGVELLFQTKRIIHYPDGRIETEQWKTSSVCTNYGDVYDPKPTIMERIKKWLIE